MGDKKCKIWPFWRKNRSQPHPTNKSDHPVVAFHGIWQCHQWIRKVRISQNQPKNNQNCWVTKSAKFHHFGAKTARNRVQRASQIALFWLSTASNIVIIETGRSELAIINPRAIKIVGWQKCAKIHHFGAKTVENCAQRASQITQLWLSAVSDSVIIESGR